MAVDALKLQACEHAVAEARSDLDGLRAGLVFMRVVDCTSGIVSEIVDSLKGQADLTKDHIDALKDLMDGLAE